MQTTQQRRTGPAQRAARIAAARRRFIKWEREMRLWGLEVTWPETFTLPSEK